MHSITMDQSPNVTMESDQNNNIENSSNNNLSIKKNEKYSLRQRGQRKSIANKQPAKNERGSRSKANNDDSDEFTALMTIKDKVAKEKPKQRAAPLSKYRRKTANARERTRMREINHAFETLRQSVPVVIAGSPAQNTNEKLTKITTLRMAMKYIKILNDILDDKTQVSDGLLASLMEYETNSFVDDKPTIPSLVAVINVTGKSKEKSALSGNALAQNHHDYCKEAVNREASVKPVKTSKATSKKSSVKASNAKTKKPASKSHSKAQKSSVKHQPLAPPITSRSQPAQIHQSFSHHETKFINHLLGGSFNQTMLHNNNNNSLNCLSKYDLSKCLTPPNDDSPADLGLILESDGESLQLSEPCFSPLELGLLLESDGESLHLSEPCLSPLNHLDALNSFNDLLHAGFNEHNSLEMYLS